MVNPVYPIKENNSVDLMEVAGDLWHFALGSATP